jgi:HAD superfamily hydrolase (TIGR01549 family)
MTPSTRPRALLFDLFGTVVHFAPQVPTVQVGGTHWRSTMNWLRETVARELPQVGFDEMLGTLMGVTEELVRQRPPEYFEVPSRERFRRALARLGVEAQCAPDMAERLSLAHMAQLASMTTLPAEHVDLLRSLAVRYPLGLVSNFDHAPTARRILAEHGLADCFDPVVISDEFGRRKPHPAIFAAALDCMGVSSAHALFIGDSVGDDVIGAHNAGLPVVWLNVKGEPLPPGVPAPDHIIAQLTDLQVLLG